MDIPRIPIPRSRGNFGNSRHRKRHKNRAPHHFRTMGERKGLVTYISPDFDPSLVPKSKKKAAGAREEIRLALPFSLQCVSCYEFMYKGRKFNAKKEVIQGETYLGLKIFRFYIRCGRCANQITFKTDPEHSSYLSEHGCTKNFEAWHEEKAAKDAAAAEDESLKLDAMTDLERRTAANQTEMEALDELAALKGQGNVFDRMSADPAAVLRVLEERRELARLLQETESGAETGAGTGAGTGLALPVLNADGLTVEDEEKLRSVKFSNGRGAGAAADSDSDDGDGDLRLRCLGSSSSSSSSSVLVRGSTDTSTATGTGARAPPVILVKRKAAATATATALSHACAGEQNKRRRGEERGQEGSAAPSALGALGAYGSENDSD